ncbi:uncharacterized protein A4U43_C01F16090 [Asparagus officinalis]|uniref:Uncharacterized protein n=1 Tax=Asparagus officinalis TaxID=4686 RepID=A0A5P1FUD3_ASPOF|nr:uncharacterized protein LOC109824050 [Asparagus officinalis]ONK80300.1 uncharacterized protein A4U43_C01F16090 [Asparagus officinalis]
MENEIQKSELLTVECELSQNNVEQELGHQQSQIEQLQEKVMEVKLSMQCSENDGKKELELLWRRVKTAATLLTYLKSKARLMAVPQLAYTSCGIKHQEGIGLIDKHGVPLSDWSKDVDLSLHESTDEELLLANNADVGLLGANDGAYIGEILKSIHMISDVMESLVKRVIMAETEAASEKQKVTLGLEEIARKTLQIDNMSAKVVEMEQFALGTNGILNEMRQKVEEMVEETSRQRQRATENEQELSRVKRDFDSLRSFVSSLISVRETLLSSEKQFQTMEKLFDRLMEKTAHLESEKAQKEAEVQKLMEENVSLRAMLDEKEAELLAMNEQCKFMALSSSGI